MSKKYLKTAFPDELTKVSSAGKFSNKLKKNKPTSSDWTQSLIPGWNQVFEQPVLGGLKKAVLAGAVILVLFGVFLRLFHLQVIHGLENRRLADSNRIQIRVIHAPRGVIYDRNGQVLAQNEPGFRIYSKEAKTRYISREEAIAMETGLDPDFKNLEVDSLRSYPLGEQTAHLLGYVGEITEQELKSPEFKNYKLGDKIGRGGIEQTYEKILKGVDGGEVIEIDSGGNKIRSLRQRPPIPGSNIILSIDAKLQQASFNALKKGMRESKACCGVAISQDPNTGQVLSLVSLPSFDPNKIEQSLAGAYSPMLNRAIGGTYPPGSTFKIVSALAGLESGKITTSTVFEDTGVMMLGPYRFANWYFSEYGRMEGPVDIFKAIQRSNDIYFYHLGQLTGEQALADSARALNLGKILGIDLPGESPGVIADNSWKLKNIGEVWYPGDTLHTAIGQGFTLVTPLQILNLTSMVANSGKEYPPHLAAKISGLDGKIIKEYKFDPINPKTIKPENMSILKQALKLVPLQGGTAWPFFNFGVPTAGKTGTAEFGDPENKTHAWYTSYAPSDDPQISLTVLVEAGGEGSTVAGAISKEIYQYYFSQDPRFAGHLQLPAIATQSARALGE